MGNILSSRATKHNKIIFEIVIDYKESLQLKGHINNIHIFSDDAIGINVKLSQRGKNKSTKYFLIPRVLRTKLGLDGEIKCQKIETDTKIIFIYSIDRPKI